MATVETNLGRVTFVAEGIFDPNKTDYKRLGVVVLDGSSYQATVDNPTGIPQLDGSNPNWQLIAQKGDDGTGGPQTLLQPAIGQIAISNGNTVNLNTVNMSGNQTGIAGNKTWTGQQTWTGAVNSFNSIGTSSHNLFFRSDNVIDWAIAKIGSNKNLSFLRYVGGVSQGESFTINNSSGTVAISNLAGTGTRLITTNSTGLLGTLSGTAGQLPFTNSAATGIEMRGILPADLNLATSMVLVNNAGVLTGISYAPTPINSSITRRTSTGQVRGNAALVEDDLVNLGQLLGVVGAFVQSSTIGQPDGVAGLDVNGKVPLSQIPTELMSLKGNWNASTNTPTLSNGTGDIGDVYIVEVAGSQDLGSGSISFDAGDWVIYSSSGVWFKHAMSGGGGGGDVSGVKGNAEVSYRTGAVNLTAANIGSLEAGTGNGQIRTNLQLDGRYLQSFTELDPTVPAHVKAITENDITDWDTAFAWGNHAGLYLPLSGGTLTGKLTLPASTTGSAGVNIGNGVAPTAPVHGDIWMVGNSIVYRDATANRTIASLQSWTNMPIAELNTGSATTSRLIQASVLNTWLNGKNFLTEVNWGDIGSKPTFATVATSGDYDDLINKPTIAQTNLALGTRTTTTVPITNSNGTGFTLPVATVSLAGLLSSADKTKLDGIATGATANQTDAYLLNRANHTGTQAVGTITGLGTAATLNVGTGNNNIVQLTPTGILPAVDGSQLTNLPSSGGAGFTGITTISGAHTLSSGDIGKYHRKTGGGGSITLTIPTNAVDPIPVNTVFEMFITLGSVNLSTTGITITRIGSGAISAGPVSFVKTDTNAWDIIGG